MGCRHCHVAATAVESSRTCVVPVDRMPLVLFSHCSSPKLPHGVVVSLDLRRPEHRVGHIVAAAMDDFAMCSCVHTRHPTLTLHELQRARHVGMMRNAFRQTGCAIRGSRVRNVVSAPCPSGFQAPKGPDRDAQDALLSAPHVREAFLLGCRPSLPRQTNRASIRLYVGGSPSRPLPSVCADILTLVLLIQQ